jgi:hypothetical protein
MIMEPKVFHGNLTTQDIGRALIAKFNRGNLMARQYGERDKVIVQIASHQFASSGGQTALTVSLDGVEDGVAIQIGKQAWLGVVASLGTTVLTVWRNPFNLLHRLDDVAQDIENIQLTTDIWETIEEVAKLKGQLLNCQTLRRLMNIALQLIRLESPTAYPAELTGLFNTTCECGYGLRLRIGLPIRPPAFSKIFLS